MTSQGAPALDDEFTALSYAHSVRLAWTVVLVMAVWVVYIAVTIWMRVGEPDSSRTLVFAGAGGFCVGLMVVVFVYPSASFKVTWRPGMRRLLAQQPWRETAVRVLSTKGTTLWLTGDEYIRVLALPATVREMIVRAGKVWLVGPDAKGRLAVRVDGLSAIWPAHRTPPLQTSAVQPTDQPITTMWLRTYTTSLLPISFGSQVLFAALGLTLAVTPPVNWVSFIGLAAWLIFAVAGLWQVRRFRSLVPTGPWTRADATSPSWRARWNGTADGTVTLDLPDGRKLTAQLNRAPLDLFANVRQEKALWLADDNVVGFPNYPILARAKLSPRT